MPGIAFRIALFLVIASSADFAGGGAAQNVPADLRPVIGSASHELSLVELRYSLDRDVLDANYAGSLARLGLASGDGIERVPMSPARIARLKRFDLSASTSSSSASATSARTPRPKVRRSFGGTYPPLYQAAYLLGGLQIRSLYQEVVERGGMPAKTFHDEVIRQNSMPIALLRLAIGREPLTPDTPLDWRFYD